MIVHEGVEWAVNSKGEILVCLEFAKDIGTPMALVLNGNVGYVLFENGNITQIDILEEILVSFAATSNILIVSLRGGKVMTEARVPISRI